MAPKNTEEKSDATAGFEGDLETLRTEFSEFRSSMEEMASQIRKSQMEFQENLQQQFKAFLDIQERPRTQQEATVEEDHGGSNSPGRGKSKDMGSPMEPNRVTHPLDSDASQQDFSHDWVPRNAIIGMAFLQLRAARVQIPA